MTDGEPAIILDVGSLWTRVGLASSEAPKEFRTLVGRGEKDGAGETTTHIGDDAVAHASTCSTVHTPVVEGAVTDWEAFGDLIERAIRMTVGEGKITNPVLLTEKILNSKDNREMITQLMFERFNVPAMNVAFEPVCALFAHGKTSGLVIDVGNDVSQITPIIDGCPVPYASSRTALAGTAVGARLKTLLGPAHESLSDETLRAIKEKLARCPVPNDPTGPQQGPEGVYELPDGKKVTVPAKIRSACGDILIDPESFAPGAGLKGLHVLAADSVLRCDADGRRDVWGSVLLCGGGALLDGLRSRLQTEISALAPSTAKVAVGVPAELKNARTLTWCGASILATLPSFQTHWVTKHHYEEAGPSVIHRQAVV